MKTKIAMHVRWMIRRDMPSVLAIEKDSFGADAWTEEQFIRALRQRDCIGMVVENDNEVFGFMIYELHRDRLVLKNIAVCVSSRRQWIGATMIDKLISKLASQRRNRIVCEVRETNLSAQLFFRKLGFKAVRVLRDYYANCKEDAYVFEYRVRNEGAL